MVQPPASTCAWAARSASSTTTASPPSTWPTAARTSPSWWRSPTTKSFVIHPGEFVLRRTLEHVELPTTSSPASRQELGWPSRPHRPRHRRLRRSGLQGDADARDHQPHPRADHPVAGQADRAAVVHDARPARRAPYGHPDLGSHYQSQVDADREPIRGRPRPPGSVGSRPMHALLVWPPRRPSPPRPRSTCRRGARRMGRGPGSRRPAQPRVPRQRAARGVMAISAVLVVAAMAAAVLCLLASQPYSRARRTCARARSATPVKRVGGPRRGRTAARAAASSMVANSASARSALELP